MSFNLDNYKSNFNVVVLWFKSILQGTNKERKDNTDEEDIDPDLLD